MRNYLPLLVMPALLAACAPRQTVVQVPTFKTERVQFQSLTLPVGGRPATAMLSVQLRVQNPNPFPVRLARAGGTFYLEGKNVGRVELPNVNLPANGEAQQEALVSLPITFANLAEFVRVGRGEPVSYRLEGDFTLDAGLFGKPTFGPYVFSQGVVKQPRILP